MCTRRRMSISRMPFAVGRSARPSPHRVALGDQVLDDLGAGGRRAEPALVHRGGQVLVLQVLAGVLHQREQARFRDARRRLRLLLDRSTRGRDLDAAASAWPGISGGSDATPLFVVARVAIARQPAP